MTPLKDYIAGFRVKVNYYYIFFQSKVLLCLLFNSFLYRLSLNPQQMTQIFDLPLKQILITTYRRSTKINNLCFLRT